MNSKFEIQKICPIFRISQLGHSHRNNFKKKQNKTYQKIFCSHTTNKNTQYFFLYKMTRNTTSQTVYWYRNSHYYRSSWWYFLQSHFFFYFEEFQKSVRNESYLFSYQLIYVSTFLPWPHLYYQFSYNTNICNSWTFSSYHPNNGPLFFFWSVLQIWMVWIVIQWVQHFNFKISIK